MAICILLCKDIIFFSICHWVFTTTLWETSSKILSDFKKITQFCISATLPPYPKLHSFSVKKVEQVNPQWNQKNSITEGNGELVSSSCSTMLHISLSAELLYSFIPLYKTEWDVAGWPFISCAGDDTILLCTPRHRTWERTWAHLKAVSDQSTRPCCLRKTSRQTWKIILMEISRA